MTRENELKGKEFLNKYLEKKTQRQRSTLEPYWEKIKQLEVEDDFLVLDARNNDVDLKLNAWGLKKGQRAGVTNILGNAGYLVLRDDDGSVLATYSLTAGDVRDMRDEDLLKITGVHGVLVLRALFGKREKQE